MDRRPRDDDLADRVADLEAALADLQTEIRRPPRGPLGLPRPPTPRELLAFTEEYAIPAAIATLEANIRALRLLEQTLRFADPERAAREESTAARRRAEDVGRVALDRIDRALVDLQGAIEEGDMPADPEARNIIEEARRLSADVEERIAASEPTRERAGRFDADEPVEIDVESELQSIKDEVEDGREDDTDE